MKNSTLHEQRRKNYILGTVTAIVVVIAMQAVQSFGQVAVTRFAVIGDYGSGDQHEADVAALVNGWNPDFIITVGDNNYPDGEASTIDRNIGQYYHQYIYPYVGVYGVGASENRFFPTLGNRDYENNLGYPTQPYIDYFTLPNNERYYTTIQGPVELFALDSDAREPDGNRSDSIQAQWLEARLDESTAPWKIVFFHHTPYSSRSATAKMRWPFSKWGATAVLAGHSHVYERIMKNGFPYMTNGLGGESTGTFRSIDPDSVVRFGSDYGAQLVTATVNSINFSFYTQAGELIDSYTISSAGISAPSDLHLVSVASTYARIGWTDNSNNEDGFRIERCAGAGCTDFVTVGTSGPGEAEFVDFGLDPETAYRYRIRGFNSVSDSDYSNILDVTTTAAEPTLLTDDFNDGVIDQNKWMIGLLSRSSSNYDPLVTVGESNGRLEIAPRASTSSNAYNGIVSLNDWDLTGAGASVELVERPDGNAVAIFSVGTDKDNWHSFRTKSRSLYLESRINGNRTYERVNFDPVEDRFLRLRHDTVSGDIVFETSPDRQVWTIQRRVPIVIDPSAVKFEMIAGSSDSVSSPGIAAFDDFEVAPN